MGWNAENPAEDYKKFYPAQVLETGHDIIFFWVIRMLLAGYEFTGQTPFETIYLHGLVLDDAGKKMSKSWGNVIDPLEVIAKHGADPLRLTLAIGTTPGNNMNFSIKNVENNGVLLNKLWNITRFVHTSVGTIEKTDSELAELILARQDELLPHERWILSRVSGLVAKVTNGMESFYFSDAGSELLTSIRDEFADFFIEECKFTKDTSKLSNETLAYCMLTFLKLLHPYIPFVTEELFGLITNGKACISSAWPKAYFKRDEKLEKEFEFLAEFIKTVRNLRVESGIKPGEILIASVKGSKTSLIPIEANKTILTGLLRLADLETVKEKPSGKDHVFGVVGDVDIYLPVEARDMEAEKARLKAEIYDKKEYVRLLDEKLLNPEFVRNAPERIVRIEQDKKTQAEEQLKKLQETYTKIAE